MSKKLTWFLFGAETKNRKKLLATNGRYSDKLFGKIEIKNDF